MIKRIKRLLYSIICLVEKFDEEITDRFAILTVGYRSGVDFEDILKDLGLDEKKVKNL